MAHNHSFVLDASPTAKYDTFATEKPSSLYVNFHIDLPCSDMTNDGRTEARLLTHGEGTYDAEMKKFVDLTVLDEQLVYQLADGNEKKVRSAIVMVGNAIIGHRSVEHSVRYKL